MIPDDHSIAEKEFQPSYSDHMETRNILRFSDRTIEVQLYALVLLGFHMIVGIVYSRGDRCSLFSNGQRSYRNQHLAAEVTVIS